MKTMFLGAVALVLLVGCTGDPDFFQYPDAASTDPGGGDGDDDDECDPTVQDDWGESCDKTTATCPSDTKCQTVEGLSSTWGICSTECCGEDDIEHCPDVAPGTEACMIFDSYLNKWYCAVLCYSDAHCNEGQTCQLSNSTDKICYPEP